MDKPSFTDKEWKDFYLSDFFEFEKGNQNNMASLANGTLPLVSTRVRDKDCVKNRVKRANIVRFTLC